MSTATAGLRRTAARILRHACVVSYAYLCPKAPLLGDADGPRVCDVCHFAWCVEFAAFSDCHGEQSVQMPDGTEMPPLADGEYDVIVLGTGLKECIISGILSVDGKKVPARVCISTYEQQDACAGAQKCCARATGHALAFRLLWATCGIIPSYRAPAHRPHIRPRHNDCVYTRSLLYARSCSLPESIQSEPMQSTKYPTASIKPKNLETRRCFIWIATITTVASLHL